MVGRFPPGLSEERRPMNDARNNDGSFATKGIENVMEWVKRCNPDMEYVDGFTSFDAPIRIRCKKCGDVFSRSMVTIRHGRKTICLNCQRMDMEERERLHAEEVAQRRAEAHAQVVLKRERLKLEQKEARRHDCPVCGRSTTRRKFCSDECCRKEAGRNPDTRRRHNALHDAKRRTLISAQIVDKGITLKRLYERDKGICWICGGVCDWDDKETREECIVTGNSYPSIDHIVELCKGGAHSWENVKLAHRICNSKRWIEGRKQKKLHAG